ncbi:hypothetical protein AVEN_222929-1, partial [Araneus ventricosus]
MWKLHRHNYIISGIHLVSVTVIKVSDGLQDRIYSKNLKNILQFLLFNDGNVCMKTRVELISDKKPAILGEASAESQNLVDGDQLEIKKPSNNNFKSSPYQRYDCVNESHPKTDLQGFPTKKIDKWREEQINEGREKTSNQISNSFVFGSPEISMNDSEKENPSSNKLEKSPLQFDITDKKAHQKIEFQGFQFSLEGSDKRFVEQKVKGKEKTSKNGFNVFVFGATESSTNDS